MARPGRRLRDLDADVAHAAELRDRGLGIVQRLAVEAVPVLDRGHALALQRAGDDHDRLALERERLGVGAVDGLDVVPVHLQRVAAERTRAVDVAARVPAVHRLAALAEPVHVEDRDQVVESVVGGVLERLPLRSLGDLAVAAEHPHAERESVELPARERHADAVRQALAERAGGDVDPRDARRRMALEDAPELPVGHELVVRDRARGLEHRVHERRRVALREDEPVVARILRRVEVVAEVLGEQHRHEIRGGHRRRRMPRLRRPRRSGPRRRAAAGRAPSRDRRRSSPRLLPSPDDRTRAILRAGTRVAPGGPGGVRCAA